MKTQAPDRPEDPYIIQRHALVTYKSKHPTEEAALREAREVLQALDPEISNDTETLGLWGSVHKRLWEITRDRAYLDTAVRAYERGFFLRNDYYQRDQPGFSAERAGRERNRSGGGDRRLRAGAPGAPGGAGDLPAVAPDQCAGPAAGAREGSLLGSGHHGRGARRPGRGRRGREAAEGGVRDGARTLDAGLDGGADRQAAADAGRLAAEAPPERRRPFGVTGQAASR
ncbi:MAG: tetratricopeptide repeat-containing protein [Longimicrobiaceae bacterium]